MTAFAVKGHTDRQHWAISTAIVVLVHGVIASAIATCWVAIRQPDLFGGAPIVIELAPAPLAPGPQQAAIPAVPEQGVPNASPDKPMEKIEEKIQEGTAAKAEEKTEPKPVGQQSVSVPMAPSQSMEGENRPDTRTAPGGSAVGAPQPGRSAEPIDTRMGDPFLSRSKKQISASERQKTLMGRRLLGPSRYFAGRQAPLVPVPANGAPRNPGATGGVTRNAIGMLVPEPAGAHETPAVRDAPWLNAGAGVARNAVGSPVATMNPAGVPASVARNAVGIVATGTVGGANPVGATAVNHPSATGIGKNSVLPGASVATAIPQAAINGTRMTIRPRASSGVIGGPARSAAGALNGTTIRAR
ncbi:MAG TPA: hypothetical protein VJ376_13590 [Pseudomonadota bacterium]|nr:hypothetical protein [Pseudomonadota bacterium]